VLQQIAQVAEAKYQVNQVSQQDLLRAQVELSNLDTELVRLRQELVSNQARLARLLHVSPNTNLQAEENIEERDIALELERLYDLRLGPLAEAKDDSGAIVSYYPVLAGLDSGDEVVVLIFRDEIDLSASAAGGSP